MLEATVNAKRPTLAIHSRQLLDFKYLNLRAAGSVLRYGNEIAIQLRYQKRRSGERAGGNFAERFVSVRVALLVHIHIPVA